MAVWHERRSSMWRPMVILGVLALALAAAPLGRASDDGALDMTTMEGPATVTGDNPLVFTDTFGAPTDHFGWAVDVTSDRLVVGSR